MATEPVSIGQVELQIRGVDLSAESDIIDIFISAIRESCETATRRALIVKQKVMAIDAFPYGNEPIEIETPPLRSIDSIIYTGTDEVEVTMVEGTDYRVIFDTSDPIMPSCVMPMYGEIWPSALVDKASVKITYTCGYGDISGTDIPAPKALVQWMLCNIANVYEHRETIQVDNRLMIIEIPTILDMLLTNYKVSKF